MRLFAPILLAALAAPAAAAPKLPPLFSRHMVLQRDAPVTIWGTSDPAEPVTVAIAGQTHAATADAAGRWSVRLQPLPAGGPHQLVVTGKTGKLAIDDVYLGEVWLASGQSNMVHIMPYSRGYDRELRRADFPQLRIFTVGAKPSPIPLDTCSGTWRPISRDSIDDVSSVAYYFGRELQERLGVPVGVIVSAVGSTPIEAWTGTQSQQSHPELAKLLADWRTKIDTYDPVASQTKYDRLHAAWTTDAAEARRAGKPVPREPKVPIAPAVQPQRPANMFNGMIAPLAPYAVRGVVWYQGEFNAQTAEYAAIYRYQLPLLIADWRSRWNRPDLPFAWVQLPNFDVTTRTPVMTGWPTVRDAMRRALAVPHTGMAVTIDVGESGSIHPAGKADIAHRLALWARAQVYGEKISWSGPLYTGHRTSDRTVELRFAHADGLKTRDGAAPAAFEIAGPDGKWHTAVARIAGQSIVLSHPEVAAPKAARYAWTSDPKTNLVNGAGLPASPFTTEP